MHAVNLIMNMMSRGNIYFIHDQTQVLVKSENTKRSIWWMFYVRPNDRPVLNAVSRLRLSMGDEKQLPPIE